VPELLYELKRILQTKMEMQQMMEMLLKEIRAGQEQTEANRKKE
jgi:hypothetical protein